jgi:Cu-processing system permease protein
MNALHRIWAVALNTFREAVRDKVLYGVLGFACAVLFFTLALAELSLNERSRVVHDVGLASISLFSVITAVFLGSSLLYKEIERKTLYIILPKPIRRHEFLLGKFGGIALTGTVFVAIMGALQLYVMAILEEAALGLLVGVPLVAVGSLAVALLRVTDRTSVLVPWSAGLFALATGLGVAIGIDLGPVLAQLLLVLGELVVLAAVALLFSSFSTPFLTGFFTFTVWLIGRSADEMAEMRSDMLSEAVKAFLHALAWVVPNFHLFVPGRHLLSGEADLPNGVLGYLGTTMAYAGVYAAVLLVAASLVFRRRDFL